MLSDFCYIIVMWYWVCESVTDVQKKYGGSGAKPPRKIWTFILKEIKIFRFLQDVTIYFEKKVPLFKGGVIKSISQISKYPLFKGGVY